jgi:archaellum component FlaC
LVEEGDAVEVGTPLVVLDIDGESRQIASEYAGLVKTIQFAKNATFAAHVTLAVLEVLKGKNQGRVENIVSDDKLIKDIEEVVERVVKPHFAAVNKRFDGVDKRFDGMDKRFDGMDKRFTGIEKTLADISNKLNGAPPKRGSKKP